MSDTAPLLCSFKDDNAAIRKVIAEYHAGKWHENDARMRVRWLRLVQARALQPKDWSGMTTAPIGIEFVKKIDTEIVEPRQSIDRLNPAHAALAVARSRGTDPL